MTTTRAAVDITDKPLSLIFYDNIENQYRLSLNLRNATQNLPEITTGMDSVEETEKQIVNAIDKKTDIPALKMSIITPPLVKATVLPSTFITYKPKGQIEEEYDLTESDCEWLDKQKGSASKPGVNTRETTQNNMEKLINAFEKMSFEQIRTNPTKETQYKVDPELSEKMDMILKADGVEETSKLVVREDDLKAVKNKKNMHHYSPIVKVNLLGSLFSESDAATKVKSSFSDEMTRKIYRYWIDKRVKRCAGNFLIHRFRREALAKILAGRYVPRRGGNVSVSSSNSGASRVANMLGNTAEGYDKITELKEEMDYTYQIVTKMHQRENLTLELIDVSLKILEKGGEINIFDTLDFPQLGSASVAPLGLSVDVQQQSIAHNLLSKVAATTATTPGGPPKIVEWGLVPKQRAERSNLGIGGSSSSIAGVGGAGVGGSGIGVGASVGTGVGGAGLQQSAQLQKQGRRKGIENELDVGNGDLSSGEKTKTHYSEVREINLSWDDYKETVRAALRTPFAPSTPQPRTQNRGKDDGLIRLRGVKPFRGRARVGRGGRIIFDRF